MSSEVAIRVEDLSKVYRIGAREARYKTLRESVMDVVGAPLKRLRRRAPTEEETLWALKDVSFEIKKGEVVGIIGRNGAGKSTLLKILSRITEPTSGRAEIHGRVGSLLEVGTGFHPELTGRENIYLNGAILGMRRAEIDRKLDEIVAFAEVERFLDTAVKHYSSGMYLRLAFAVAAHLDTEVLLVDEVLAVGDASFQKRCLQRLQDVSHLGRTVLFVSHNLQAIQGLCERALRFQGGELTTDGTPGETITEYLRSEIPSRSGRTWLASEAPGNEFVLVTGVRLACRESPAATVTMRTPFTLQFDYTNRVEGAVLSPSVNIFDEMGTLVLNTAPVAEPLWYGKALPVGTYSSEVDLPGDLLNSGRHSVELLFVQDARHVVFRLSDALVFEVADTPELRGGWYGRWPGVVHPQLPWLTTSTHPQL